MYERALADNLWSAISRYRKGAEIPHEGLRVGAECASLLEKSLADDVQVWAGLASVIAHEFVYQAIKWPDMTSNKDYSFERIDCNGPAAVALREVLRSPQAKSLAAFAGLTFKAEAYISKHNEWGGTTAGELLALERDGLMQRLRKEHSPSS